MSTHLKLLDQNNKKLYGGGNIKQGIMPSATAFFGMRLKTNLNATRNGGTSGNPYDGVCFIQFDRSIKCGPRKDGLIMVAAPAGGDTVGFGSGEYDPPGSGPLASGSLNPSSAAGTEILYIYTNSSDNQWPDSGPRQINLRFTGNVPTSFTITGVFGGGATSSSYTLRTDWVNGISLDNPGPVYRWYMGDATLPNPPGANPTDKAAIPWPGFLFISGQTYTIFID